MSTVSRSVDFCASARVVLATMAAPESYQPCPEVVVNVEEMAVYTLTLSSCQGMNATFFWCQSGEHGCTLQPWFVR